MSSQPSDKADTTMRSSAIAHNIDWDLLRTFHAVVETMSFTQAGRTLNVSQSSVSRQIASLEKALKVVLFHRYPHGLALTESGETLRKTALDMFEKMVTGVSHINEYREEPRGPLKITTSVGFGSVWLTPRLTRFRTLYPDVATSLLLTDSLELDLSLRQADVAVRFFAQTQPTLIQQHLMSIQFHAFASKEYLKQRGVPKGADDLDKHDIIVYGDELPSPVADINWLLAAGSGDGHRREPVLRVSSVHAIFQAIRVGFGIGSLPHYFRDEDSAVVEILGQLDGPRINAYLVYPEDIRNSRRVRVLREFLLKEGKEEKKRAAEATSDGKHLRLATVRKHI